MKKSVNSNLQFALKYAWIFLIILVLISGAFYFEKTGKTTKEFLTDNLKISNLFQKNSGAKLSPLLESEQIPNPSVFRISEINYKLSSKKTITTRELLEERKELLKELIREDPNSALQVEEVSKEIIEGLSEEELNELVEFRGPVIGKVEIAVADESDEDGNFINSHEEFFIFNQEETIQLFGNIPDVKPETEIQITGIKIGELMVIDDAEGGSFIILTDPPEGLEIEDNFGVQRTLVMIGTFEEGKVPGISWTEGDEALAIVNESLFEDNDHSLRDYYINNSYGNIFFEGEIAGPYMMYNESYANTTDDFFTKLVNASLEDGIPVNEFSRYIFAFPATSGTAGWAGLAYVGMKDGTINGSPTRYSHCYVKENIRSLRVVTHEVGHNLGAGHSQRLHCYNGTTWGGTPISDYCSRSTYGDFMDVMGGSTSGYFHAIRKHGIGWLPPQNTLKVTNGTYDIYPIEILEEDNEIRSLRIPIIYENNVWGYEPDKNVLSIDFRKAIGYNNPFHVGWDHKEEGEDWDDHVNTTLETQGVHVRYSRDITEYENIDYLATQLLIIEPNITRFQTASGYNVTVHRHALLKGETLTDHYNGVNITVDDVTEDYATVTVESYTPFDKNKPLLNYTFSNNEIVNTGGYAPYTYLNPALRDGTAVSNEELVFDGDSSLEFRSIGRYATAMVGGEGEFTLMFTIKPEIPINSFNLGKIGPIELELTSSYLAARTLFDLRNEEGYQIPPTQIELIGNYSVFSDYSHVALTFNGSEVRIYINGVLMDSATDYNGTGYWTPHFELYDSFLEIREDSIYHTLNMTLGNKYIGGVEGGLIGNIDNFSVYARALSEEEVSGFWQGSGEFIIEPESPTYYDSFNYENIDFRIEVVNNRNLNYCTLYIDGLNKATVNSPPNQIDFGFFEVNGEGIHEWSATCENEIGEVKESQLWEFSLDYTNPSFIDEIHSESVAPMGYFYISSTWSDINPQIVRLMRDGEEVTSAPWTYDEELINIIGQADSNPGGTMTFTLIGEDKAGNQKETEEITIMISGGDDITPPTILNFELLSNETIFDPQETIEINVIIEEENPTFYSFIVNNQSVLNYTYESLIQQTFNWTIDQVYKNSNITLSIMAYDLSENIDKSSEIILEVTGNISEDPIQEDPEDPKTGTPGGDPSGTPNEDSSDQEDEEEYEEIFLEEEMEIQLFPEENIFESIRLSIPTEDYFKLTTEIDEEISELIKVEEQPVIDRNRNILIDISIPKDQAPGVYTGEIRFSIEKLAISENNPSQITGEVILANLLKYITGYAVLQGEETDTGFNYILEIALEVKDPTNKPVNLKLTPKKSKINTDEDIELDIELNNNLPEEKNIDLSISLLDSALENVKGQLDYTLEVEEEYTDTKNLDLYETLEPGKYVIKGVAKHSSAEEGSGVISMSKLSVNKPFLNYTLFGIKMKYYLIIYALMLLAYAAYLVYDHTKIVKSKSQKKSKSKAKSQRQKSRQRKKHPK